MLQLFQDVVVQDYIPLPSTEEFQSVQISADPIKSPVPRTLGTRRKSSDEVYLILCLCWNIACLKIYILIENVLNKNYL